MKNNLTITERERRLIFLISQTSEQELYALECLIAGVRLKTLEIQRQDGNRCAEEENT